MDLHFITLQRQASFLTKKLQQGIILASYSQKKNEQILHIQTVEDCLSAVILSCDAAYPFILQRPAQKRGRQSTDVLPDLIQKKIDKIEILPDNRILIVYFQNWENRFLLQLFRNRTNFFIVNSSNMIISAFKNQKKFTGQAYAFSGPVRPHPGEISQEDFREIISKNPDSFLRNILKNQFAHISSPIIEELSIRLKMNFSRPVTDFSPAQLDNLWVSLTGLLQSCQTDPPRIYFEDGYPVSFALTSFLKYENHDCKTFECVNDALTFYIFQRQKRDRIYRKTSVIQNLLSKKLYQLEHHLNHLRSLPDEWEQRAQFQKIGELLLAQMYTIPEKSSSVELPDLFDPQQNTLRIVLNPKLTIKENAQYYFQKAKDVSYQQKKIAENIRNIIRQKKKLESYTDVLKISPSYDAMVRLERQLEEMHILQTDDQRMQEIYRPYKQYFYQNWEIWVGKNARANDEMTFKLAKKEDLWLHAQGVAGSHIIIRKSERKSNIPKDVIEYAARLAALNSGAKHSSFAPVLYTQVRYLRKARGNQPGAVIPSQVKTIFVEPPKINR